MWPGSLDRRSPLESCWRTLADEIEAARIEGAIKEGLGELGSRYVPSVFPSLASTNGYLRAQRGLPLGTVLLALAQSQGRGRKGRSFYSPGGTGLYLSMLLDASFARRLTAIAGLVLCESLESFGAKDLGLKWINDIEKSGRKVAGILTEKQEPTAPASPLILGVGVNVFEPERGFPKALAERAGPVFETKDACSIEALALSFIKGMHAALHERRAEDLHRAYAERSLAIGRHVYHVQGGETQRLWIRGLGEDFSLLAEDEAGQPLALRTGEIEWIL